MPKLWLILALGYLIAGIAIYLDHMLRFPGMWNWSEAWHHEAFLITTIWVSVVYLTVAVAEYIMRKRRRHGDNI